MKSPVSLPSPILAPGGLNPLHVYVSMILLQNNWFPGLLAPFLFLPWNRRLAISLRTGSMI